VEKVRTSSSLRRGKDSVASVAADLCSSKSPNYLSNKMRAEGAPRDYYSDPPPLVLRI
jgi:hypothetical protein